MPTQNTPSVRAVRREYTQQLRQAEPDFVLDVARVLLYIHGDRWVAYELIRYHPAAFQSLEEHFNQLMHFVEE